jgi:hypothetical protein
VLSVDGRFGSAVHLRDGHDCWEGIGKSRRVRLDMPED